MNRISAIGAARRRNFVNFTITQSTLCVALCQRREWAVLTLRAAVVNLCETSWITIFAERIMQPGKREHRWILFPFTRKARRRLSMGTCGWAFLTSFARSIQALRLLSLILS